MNKYYKIYPISRDEANVEVKFDTNYNLNHLDVKTLDNLIGVLDLLGFEDKTEEDNDYVMPEMKAMETDFMELSNINDYAYTKDIVKLLNNADKRIAELEQELAELKEKAIVPRFEYGDKVYYIKYFVGKWQVFNQEYVGENISNIIVRTMNYYSELPKDSVFATEQEAQAKLKELKGNG